MKKLTFFLTLIFIYSILSCSSESTDDSSGGITTEIKLVKKEFIHTNAYIEYSYNEINLLSQINEVWDEENIDSQINYTYDSNNNVIEKYIESNITSENWIENYSYDASNRLVSQVNRVSYNTGIEEYTYSYADNIITINRTFNSSNTTTITLETNSFGLITKYTKINGDINDFYFTINYDSNRNITEVNTFDVTDNLLRTHIYSYDNNINPFYGQLESIYLSIFLNAFEDAWYGEIVYEGYDGYWFPFLKNNIATKTITSTTYIQNYLYEYDTDNYPIRVSSPDGGENEENFDIEYY